MHGESITENLDPGDQCIHHAPFVIKADLVPAFEMVRDTLKLRCRDGVRGEVGHQLELFLPLRVQLLDPAVGVLQQKGIIIIMYVKK